MLFGGREWDASNRTYLNRHRVYAPEEGRFLSRDPLGYVDGFDQYAYCGGNPVNFLDPMGMNRWDFWRNEDPRPELGSCTLELIDDGNRDGTCTRCPCWTPKLHV